MPFSAKANGFLLFAEALLVSDRYLYWGVLARNGQLVHSNS
jgi:hypothetical protein